jgi:hypothetical protein
VNEMTEICSGATCRSVEIAAWHGAVVARLDQLIGVWGGISGSLCFRNLVCLFELKHSIVCEFDQLVVLHVLVLRQQGHNIGPLIYKKDKLE